MHRQVFLLVHRLGRVEVDPPAVVVNLPPQACERVLAGAPESEAEHAHAIGVDGGEVADQNRGEAQAGACDGGQAVQSARADVVESLLLGLQGVLTATEAPPDVLGPLLADPGEIPLLLVLDDPGGDADVVVALLGDLGALPECGQPVEQG